MGLESTATYIDSLNLAWPDGADLRSTGDNHIRLVKGAISRTFPGITGAVNRTHTELNNIGSLSFSLLNSLKLVDTTKLGYAQTTAEISASVTPVNFFIRSRRPERIVLNVTPGTTDMTADLQAALNACPQYSSIIIDSDRSQLMLISGLITVPTDNITIYGNGAILKAKANTQFQNMFSAAGRTGVIVRDLEFDINGSNRTSGQSTVLNAATFGTSTDCALINCIVRNSRGYSSTSATAVVASAVTRFKAIGNTFLDCGPNTTTEPSDALFVRGDNCLISENRAYRVTDTAYVLEGCNYSRIANNIADECTSLAAITNDTASDCVGNTIAGLTGTATFIGSTGGLVGVACFGAGNLRQSKVSDVTIRVKSGATGLGPGIQVRKTSTGRVIGLDINNPTIDIGSGSGVLAQALLISSSDKVIVNNPTITQDLTAGASCIRFDGDCVGGQVNAGLLTKADRGVLVKDTSEVDVTGVRMVDQNEYGIDADDTSTVTSRNNKITGSSLTGYENKASGATLISDYWQSWTPTYASDVGNAATTFSGAVTTTLMRYRLVGKRCEVEFNYSATLNAVTPVYISLTLPSGVAPTTSNVYAPTVISNAGTEAIGVVRAITSTNELRIYRVTVAAYGSGAAVIGKGSFSFEIA